MTARTAGGGRADATSAAITTLAVGLAAVSVAASLTTVGLALANRATIHSLEAVDPISVIMPIGFAIVGALVASRRRRNPTGWLFLFIAVDAGLSGVTDQYARLALITDPGSVPGGVWAVWLANWVMSLVYPAGAASLLMLLLPDGHLPSPRWRPILILSIVLAAIFAIPIGALAPTGMTVAGADSPQVPNPLGLPALQPVSFGGQWFAVPLACFLLSFVVLTIAGAAPLVRMRRSQGDERQQLKWVAYALVTTVIVSTPLAILTWGIPLLASVGWISTLSIALGFGVGLPIAAGIAIFKHRLYDIDIVISRTLVYGSLAVFITAVYVGIAVGIGALVGGGGKPNLGLSILATAIVAVGFQPLRERLQRVANRLVYGKRATPYEVLSEFSERVAESYAMDEVLPRMARVLAEGTGAQRADIWLRTGEWLRSAATWPVDAAAPDPLPATGDGMPPIEGIDRMVVVRHQADVLGALSVSKRAGEGMTPVEESLLSHLASQAGLVLKNVGLATQLQSRLEELRVSRQRLVAAQDEERRRLERNLHDGAQQHLVAIKVKLGIAEILMARDPAKARSALRQLKADADEALSTLRDLARGIYPPLLADQGLAAALDAQARKATVPVTVDADGIGRYPQEVEAAAYFCCLEALQNVQKYAQATAVTVSLAPVNGALVFTVTDDGRGFDLATTRRGSGLANMEDRLDALGGHLNIASTPGAGTTLRGEIPARTDAQMEALSPRDVPAA